MDLLVEIRDLDHQTSAHLSSQALDVALVAGRQSPVIVEVLEHPTCEILVAQRGGELGRQVVRVVGQLALVVDLVHDHATERQLCLHQLAVEVDGLGDRLALWPADDQEAGLGVGEQLADPLGALAKAPHHAAERLEELREVLEHLDPRDASQHREHHRGSTAEHLHPEPGRSHEHL